MSRSSHKRTYIRRERLAAAIVLAAIVVGALVWLIIHFVTKGSEDHETVSLKKSDTALSASSSQGDSSSQQDSSLSSQSSPEASIPRVRLSAETAVMGEKSILFTWTPVEGATEYAVYRMNDNKWEKVGVTKMPTYEDGNVQPEQKYFYKVAVLMGGTEGEASDPVELQFIPVVNVEYKRLFFVPKGTYFYNDDMSIFKSSLADGYFTGAPDEKNTDMLRLDTELDTKLVKADTKGLKEVADAKALSLGNIGQEGGSINGSSACGPTAAAILVKAETGEVWDKDELIKFTEAKGLADQGSMMGDVGKGGMSAPMVIKLIESYSKGNISSVNEYNDKEKPSVQLMNLIDSGKRCILSVRYAWGIVHHPYSIIHFVTIGGYEKASDGKVYFYYSDSAHGNDLRGLGRVEADELDESVLSVKGEPICMITVGKGTQAASEVQSN